MSEDFLTEHERLELLKQQIGSSDAYNNNSNPEHKIAVNRFARVVAELQRKPGDGTFGSLFKIK